MVAKQKRRRGIARSSSKKTTNEVLDNCSMLKENPQVLIPECAGQCRKCRFDAYRKYILKIKEFEDEPAKLKKFSRRGFQLVRAYAVCLMILHEDGIPIMARFKNELGEYPYVVRGAVRKEFLIGLQHFQDPSARLMAYVDIYRKKKINIYSGKRLYCSGQEEKPPLEFIDYVMGNLKINFVKSDNIYTCQHLKKSQVSACEPFSKPYVIMEWISAEVSIGICKSCIKDNMHIFRDISNNMLTADDSWFSIKSVYRPECKSDCESCGFSTSSEGMENVIQDYKSLVYNESNFIDSWIKRKRELVSDKIFINGNNCYGKDINGFIESLSPSEIEKKALGILLEQIMVPVIEENTSANKILTNYWGEFGKVILEGMGYSESAIEHYGNLLPSEISASEILNNVNTEDKKEKALAGYPEYTSLEPVPEFIDYVAKSYRYDEQASIIRSIDRRVTVNPELKSLGLSFLLVMGRGENRRWQYSSYEYDQGKYLEKNAKKLLECKAEEYESFFRDFLTAYGYDLKRLE